MNPNKHSELLRFVILGILLLVLLIPIALVEDLVTERLNRSQDATSEISSKWGGVTRLYGPLLVVPHMVSTKRESTEKPGNFVIQKVMRTFTILPDELEISTDLTSEIRKRGIYSAVLFQTENEIKGSFSGIDSSLLKNSDKIYWEDSYLLMLISDPKGIGKDVALDWNGKTISWEPGAKGVDFYGGIHAPLGKNGINPGKKIPFSIRLPMKGNGSIAYGPVGKSTSWEIRSNWPDPSFIGSILPETREITKDGFTAKWESSYYKRNYPQYLPYFYSDTMDKMGESSFGVNLFQKLDQYTLVTRSLKYAILVILASFTVYFLMEILSHKKLHPIQYALIGSAMIVFYILNLAFSEHIGFGWAYTIASIVTSLLIGYYSANILENTKKGYVGTGYFLFLYLFLYIILSAEDYALLLGSVAIFILLSMVMYFTRKMDWFAGSTEGSNNRE